MEFYMENRDNGRMILDSVQNGPLVWPTITEEDGTTRKRLMLNFLLLKSFKLIAIAKLPILFFKDETLCQYYWRFAQLINNMNVINMSMRPVQVNTKFLNSLPLEWSKFVTGVKLARDLHTTNYNQLYSYLEQHEMHANETRLMREGY
nr:UBN2 domain-containing protein [Tanacetum cinerariifolium]GEX09593.1 UBN2 domain-containing protein [Tanacetum cinerariifolium]